MSVTIYEDVGGGGEVGYFPDPASAQYLSNYSMDFFYTWDNEISSLYTSTYLYVFEAPGFAYDYSGEAASAILPPGFHDLDDLNAYGISNDAISSFYAF